MPPASYLQDTRNLFYAKRTRSTILLLMIILFQPVHVCHTLHGEQNSEQASSNFTELQIVDFLLSHFLMMIVILNYMSMHVAMYCCDINRRKCVCTMYYYSTAVLNEDVF